MNKLLIFLIFASNILLAQNTCEAPEESLEDLNSITKCSINTSKKTKDNKTRQISVKVSASKKRFLKKRSVQKKSAVTGVNSLNTSGVSELNSSSAISNSLSLEKENMAESNIAHLTNTMSAEEVKKAQKFSAVDQIPLFTGCKSVKNKEKLNCFNTEMIKHIQEHFSYPNSAIIDKIQGNVWVRFIIDKHGNVSNIKTLGPKGGKILDQEAMRVVSKLPKFIAGVKDGEKIPVKYGFPISFSLEE